MLNLADVFPFYNIFVLLDTIVVYMSIGLFAYFISLKHRLVIWIKNDEDEKLRTYDELSLLLTKKGIKNSFLTYVYSSVVYLIFYIFK